MWDVGLIKRLHVSERGENAGVCGSSDTPQYIVFVESALHEKYITEGHSFLARILLLFVFQS